MTAAASAPPANASGLPRRNTQTVVAKLQRRSRRSSAAAVVDNAVDNAWIALGYAGATPRIGLFCLSLFATHSCA